MLMRVSDSLASDLCSYDDCRILRPAQSPTVDVALSVVATDSNFVTLIVTPEGIKASLETIRSWLRHHAPEKSVVVQSRSVDGQVFVENEDDVRTSIAVIRVTFGLL
jgi:hypothetical protein